MADQHGGRQRLAAADLDQLLGEDRLQLDAIELGQQARTVTPTTARLGPDSGGHGVEAGAVDDHAGGAGARRRRCSVPRPGSTAGRRRPGRRRGRRWRPAPGARPPKRAQAARATADHHQHDDPDDRARRSAGRRRRAPPPGLPRTAPPEALWSPVSRGRVMSGQVGSAASRWGRGAVGLSRPTVTGRDRARPTGLGRSRRRSLAPGSPLSGLAGRPRTGPDTAWPGSRARSWPPAARRWPPGHPPPARPRGPPRAPRPGPSGSPGGVRMASTSGRATLR